MRDLREHNLPVGSDLHRGHLDRHGAVGVEDHRRPRDRDVRRALTDHNPVHLDDAYARDTIFEGRIAHGMLTAALISAVIGEQLPGHGTVYLGQTLKFRAPVRPGRPGRGDGGGARDRPCARRVTLDCACRVGDTVVLEGEALVLAPSRKLRLKRRPLTPVETG